MFIDSIKALWPTCSQHFLSYLAFQPFDFERSWWKLFQKRVVRTKFDIYVFITLFRNCQLKKIYLIIYIKCRSTDYWAHIVISLMNSVHQQRSHPGYSNARKISNLLLTKHFWKKINRLFINTLPLTSCNDY